GSAQAEEAFFENGIAAVPKSEPEAKPALPIANPQQAVLAPTVGATAGMIVRKVPPARPIDGVVLTNSSPLPLGQIRTPTFPIFLPVVVFLEPLIFSAGRFGVCHGVSPRGTNFKAAEFMQ